MRTKSNRGSSARFWRVVLPRAIAIVALLGGATGVAVLMVMTSERSVKRPQEVASLVVQTIETRHRELDRVWSGYGTARAMQSAEIVAEVSGRVVERPESIEPGRRVRKGDLIVRLDDTDYVNALDGSRQAVRAIEAQIEGLDVEEEQTRLQVQYAAEEIEAARRDLARIDEAVAAGVANGGERDATLAAMLRAQRQLASLRQQLDLIPSRRLRLLADLASQRANERLAQENVRRATIRAPFDAELQRVTPRVGDWLSTGTSVARVVDLTRLEVPLKLPASASSWVRVGDEARLWVRSPVGEPDWVGQVVRVSPEADAASRTITVYVEVRQDPDDSDRLLPGQFVQGRVLTRDKHERVVLPRRAVQSDTVFVARAARDGVRRVEKVPVRVAYSFQGRLPDLDPIETEWVALEQGYEPDEGAQVVVSLLDQIVTGMKVRLDSDAQSPAPTGVGAGEGRTPEGGTP